MYNGISVLKFCFGADTNSNWFKDDSVIGKSVEIQLLTLLLYTKLTSNCTQFVPVKPLCVNKGNYSVCCISKLDNDVFKYQ